MHMLFKNGKVVLEEEITYIDLLVGEGKFLEIGHAMSASRGQKVIDCTGKVILPGIIDAHTHFYMLSGLGERTVDSFFSGSIAAACGGVTTVIDYIEPLPGQKPLAAYKQRRKEAIDASIDYGLHLVIKEWNKEYSRELKEIKELGVTSLKAFTAYKNLLLSGEKIHELLVWAGENDMLVTFHAEEEAIIDNATKTLQKRGCTNASYFAETRPKEAELEAVKRILGMSQKTGTPVYIAHVSSPPTLDLVREFKRNGFQAFIETCPHYLYLNSDVYKDSPVPQLFFVCPPLREEKEREGLWKALRKNVFSVIATDHCAFSRRQKCKNGALKKIPPGIPGVETLLPLMYLAVSLGALSLTEMVKLLATEPAKIFGLYPRKGVIKKGSDADLVVFNPASPVTLSEQNMHSLAGYTPYERIVVPGYPELTVLRGKIIYDKGKFTGEKSYGQFLQRSTSAYF